MTPTTTTPPFSAKGLSWSSVFKLLGIVLPVLFTLGMAWLGTQFVTQPELKAASSRAHEELATAVEPLRPLPSQVQSLQEFRARQERVQERSDAKFETIQQDLAALKAIQIETGRNVNRVLDALQQQERDRR